MQTKVFLSFLIFISLWNVSLSQTNFSDTLKISEIEIIEKKIATHGFKQTIIYNDSNYWLINDGLDVVLKKSAGIYIKNYGLGGIASSSIRGGTAAQTQVLWNGVKLNSPMLGQSDLSLLPLSGIDEIRLIHGGTSSIENSGGLGGTILLSNIPNWSNNSISVGASTNSLFNNSFSSQINLNSNFISSKTRLFYSDFQHKELAKQYRFTLFTKKGFQQDVFLKKNKHKLNFHLLSIAKSSSLPSTISDNENTVNQLNAVQLEYNYHTSKGQIKLNNAIIFDKYDYTNNLAEIKSNNNSFSAQNRIEFIKQFKGKSFFSLGFNSDYNSVVSNNYENTITQHLNSAFFAINWQFSDRIKSFALSKLSVLNSDLLPVQPSFGTEIKMLNSAIWFTKISISKNYRLATFNDKYWQPYGNPNLKPENGYSAEFGQKLDFDLIDFEITAFYSDIQNRIAWIPVTATEWKPVNYNQTKTNGIEINTNFNKSISQFNYDFSLFYTYTNSIENTENIKTAQAFIPKNQASINNTIKYQKLLFIVQYQHLGKRPINQTQTLEADNTLDMKLARIFKIKPYNLKLSLSVNNILNSNTQLMPGYPKAPRNFGISVLMDYELGK